MTGREYLQENLPTEMRKHSGSKRLRKKKAIQVLAVAWELMQHLASMKIYTPEERIRTALRQGKRLKILPSDVWPSIPFRDASKK